VLLSGGLDSATLLAMARREGFDCYCLSFDYGQSHRAELDAARHVAEALGARAHRVITIDPAAFAGGSALTGGAAIPKNRDLQAEGGEIPATYVPARNTIFLAYALGWAEMVEAEHVFIGVNALDYSGYPDCRPEYIEAFGRLAALATKAGVEGRPVRVHTPLIQMSKAEIIAAGMALGVDYGPTLSCYDPAPGGAACGACDACVLRKKGFAEAGIADPTRYANG
jgi:7-cyano-7-deazaguanine synthase